MFFKPRFFYGYAIVILAFLVMAANLGLQTSFSIFFKPMTEELGWARTVTSGAFSLSQIMGGLSFILMGWLFDRYGIRLILVICGILTVIGYLLMSQVEAVWQIYLYFGILVGIGSAVFAPLLSTVARWFVKRRSMMTGISFAGVGFGMLVFPPLINWFITLYDWRVAFIIVSIIIFFIALAALFLMISSPAQAGQKPYGEAETTEEEAGNEGESFTLRQAMQTRHFWLFCCSVACFGFCFFSIQLHIAPYATDSGISSAGAATVMAVIGGASIAGQILLGSAGDRIGNKRAFLVGLVLLALGVVIAVFAKDLWMFILLAVLLGLGFGDCGTQESPIGAWLFGLKSHGVIFGFIAFSFTIGSAIGPTVFGAIFDATGSYTYAFVVSIILAVAALSMTAFVRKTPLKPSVEKLKP